MNELRIPSSGRLLVSHLAAFGLALCLDVSGERAFVAYEADDAELPISVLSTADADRAAQAVREGAQACRTTVERDVVPGQPLIKQVPAIRARAGNAEVAQRSFAIREQLLDVIDDEDALLVGGLLAGLGAPAVWLRDRRGAQLPALGASRLDGVALNSTSDIVRGALRKSIVAALDIDGEGMRDVLDPGARPEVGDEDRTMWSPGGSPIPLPCQWLAALGLGLLPVGLRASDAGVTPCAWTADGRRGTSLPVLRHPVSVPRLRALLQRQELCEIPLDAARAGHLRALGVVELACFTTRNRGNDKMQAFSFALATRLPL